MSKTKRSFSLRRSRIYESFLTRQDVLIAPYWTSTAKYWRSHSSPCTPKRAADDDQAFPMLPHPKSPHHSSTTSSRRCARAVWLSRVAYSAHTCILIFKTMGQ